ncbi:peptide-methionine (S)-S-oxide reductase MsrA [Dokdonella ginsengisoli]|uniref:Peptide methionine sulfoxide reductase MsrA n=1 Tax=Dokdonella ginsengisoli TaxID=363846 RepID=A0ABV9QSR1_9GAMM
MLRCLALLLLLLTTEAFAMNEEPGPNGAAAPTTETLTLGGGCFWCVEAVYAEIRGVNRVESGYSGGTLADPTYEQVSSGRTGHAEVVQITFDPRVVSRDTLLRAFFTIHDPTTPDRQGNDVGPQYRSIAFYRDEAQKAAIERAIRETADSREWNGAIVTQVEPFKVFYKAENYHQEYFKLHGEQPYCQLVVAPKIAKFRKRFHDLLKS